MRKPQEERSPSTQRTLQTLDDDLQGYITDGSKLSRAKLFNNVISEPMFRIPLTQVNVNKSELLFTKPQNKQKQKQK